MDDRADILAANTRFYSAFENRDLVAMAACWSGSELDVCIHPGWEPVHGFRAVMDAWAAIIASNVPMKFLISDVRVHIQGDLARLHNVEHISLSTTGETLGRVAVTHLFARRAGEWKLILHHGSPIAGDGEAPSAEADYN